MEAQDAHSRLEVISYTTLAEINHFNQFRVGDFKQIMQKYLQQQIEFHENVSLYDILITVDFDNSFHCVKVFESYYVANE